MIRMVKIGNAGEDGPNKTNFDRSGRAPKSRDGNTPEPRSFPDAGDPRPRVEYGRFHVGRRSPKHSLGPVAGSSRCDCRSFRSTFDNGGRRRDLCHRACGHGCGRWCAGADRIWRVDRRGAVVHRFVARVDRHCARDPRTAQEQGAGHRFRRRVARHVADPADHPNTAHAPSLAGWGTVFSASRRHDAACRVLCRRRRPAARIGRAEDHNARDDRSGGAAPTVSRHVRSVFRLRS